MSKEKIYRIIIIVLSVLLVATTSLLIVQLVNRAKLSQYEDTVKNNSIGPAEKEWVFSAENVLPGDTESKSYVIEFHMEEDADVDFRAEIEDETNDFSKVLTIRVENKTTGKEICNGKLSEISGKDFKEIIKYDGTIEKEITYKITVTFDSSAGNEYQGAQIKMNFKWVLKNGGKGND